MKKRKAKPVAYELIPRQSDHGRPMYQLLDDLVEQHHQDINQARIALAWCTSWKPDADGHITLGKCKKASDLDRELMEWDFIVLLNQLFWQDEQVTPVQRLALLDHELCHAAIKFDSDGEPQVDTRGRPVFRIRKHDLEEFGEIAERHGVWKKDIEQFAASLDKARAKSSRWVGYSALQAVLKEAGVMVPLETIMSWSESERREASVWADLYQHNQAVTSSMPGHVHAAMMPYESTKRVREVL